MIIVVLFKLSIAVQQVDAYIFRNRYRIHLLRMGGQQIVAILIYSQWITSHQVKFADSCSIGVTSCIVSDVLA